MLSGKSAAERADRRAAKTQSLYIATPTSNSLNNNTLTTGAHSAFLPHNNNSNNINNNNSNSNPNGYSGQQQQQQQQQQPSSPFNFNTTGSSALKSPKKSRPFSMLFLQPQDEQARLQQQQQQQYQSQPQNPQQLNDGFDLDYQQQQQQTINESDEDALVDGQSLSSVVLEYGESDLKDVDSETRKLIEHLTDLDSGLPILLERVKQNLHSCKDMISFLKKRSVMEAEYGTNILKLATGFRDTYRQQAENQAHTKQGSFGDCWIHILEMHERLGNNRLEFSRDLQNLSDELSAIYKETDKSRKQFKEAGSKQERIVQEHEQNLEKAKQKYDSLTEEWERAILQKVGDPAAAKKTMTKGMNIFRQPKTVGQLNKQEEEAKNKATTAHEQYKAQLARTNDARQYYYSNMLPSILKNLKDTIDESDLSLQYYLTRYGYMYEDYMMKDAVILNPINENDMGMRDRINTINRETDLQVFIQAYSAKATPVVRSAAPYQEYLMSAQAQAIINPKPIFGVDLAEQLIRDEADLPEIVVKCTQAIEQFGMDTKGIYRVSGITSATNRLRSAFDRDCSAVDLSTEENCGDINSVASVLKSWFRELPDPLLTRKLYPDFIKAASIEDPDLQLMNLHQVTNQLPDPNYATLKFLMCHLNRVQANSAVNMMGPSNLGLIFGPTLSSGGTDAVNELADMGLQCRIIETLLANYGAIFDFDEEEEVDEATLAQQHQHQDYHHQEYHGADPEEVYSEVHDLHHHHQQQQQQHSHHFNEYEEHHMMNDHELPQQHQHYDEYGLPIHPANIYGDEYAGGDRMVPVAEEDETEAVHNYRSSSQPHDFHHHHHQQRHHPHPHPHHQQHHHSNINKYDRAASSEFE